MLMLILNGDAGCCLTVDQWRCEEWC